MSATALVARPSKPAADAHRQRDDIQGLRAVAVLAVLIYHLAPHALPGGFVGVDVFFVVSGYLITGQLARTAQRAGRVRLLDFWGRRARRLLPAAAVVLAVTWLVSLRLLPAARLIDTAAEVRASALYVQNWLLARKAVDYLQSTDAPSPLQHYWSLSVEEQFYLAWPLLFLAAWAVARAVRARSSRTLTVALVAIVFAVSLACSIVLTGSNPAAAYFVTTTRAWELALGGLLALLPAAAARWLAGRTSLSMLGLAMVLASLVWVNAGSVFPGAIALVPTVGTGLLLVTGQLPGLRAPARLLARRPLVVVGDLSYSLYLWHWPVIVLWKNYTAPSPLAVWQALVITAVSFALAWATKRFVEDPIRRARVVTRSPRRSLATAGALALPIGLVALLIPTGAPHPPLDARHPGAAALATGLPAPTAPMVPALVAASQDTAGFESCEVVNDDSRSTHCRLGDTAHPRLTVAVVGDSVVGQWQIALDAIARQNHWLLITDYKASCEWSATMTAKLGTSTPYQSCYQWGQNALHDLLTNVHPDVVITSGRAAFGTPGHPAADSSSSAAIAQGMAAYWRQLIKAGTQVVALAETPEMGRNMPDCLSSLRGSVDACSVPRSKALPADRPIEQAARLLGGRVPVVNMNSLICSAETCSPVVGNVVVYMDQHHLTETYTRTLEPYLQAKLLAVPALQTPIESRDAMPAHHWRVQRN